MIKKIQFIFLAVFCVSVSANAQDAAEIGTAELSDTYRLAINEDLPIQEYYQADITAFGFSDAVEAKKIFGTKCNNLITYTVDFETNTVIAHLHLDRTSAPYDREWWSAYLITVCELY
ncbi:MAG: hypothetical protein JKY19_16530 [Alcanivoracaceae bacterium]|nr:hypothetical protein [Alcanivoracaceae bacterium]